MNSAPSKPVTTPNTIAAGKSNIEFSLAELIVVNLTAPESDSCNGEPVKSELKIDSVNVAIDVAVNTRHNILNVQKVFGFEIS